MASLVDTDIVIDYLRNHPSAIAVIEKEINELSLSVMTVAELHQGVRNEKEKRKLALTLSAFIVLPITMEIAVLGGSYSAQYRGSHGVGLADSLIAATAKVHDLSLRTLNAKYYPMFSKIEVPYKK